MTRKHIEMESGALAGTEQLDKVDSDNEELVPAEQEMEQEQAADQRNQDRAEQANAADQKLTCECLPSTSDFFLPKKTPGPEDTFVPPA
jgi:hypothetical protein